MPDNQTLKPNYEDPQLTLQELNARRLNSDEPMGDIYYFATLCVAKIRELEAAALPRSSDTPSEPKLSERDKLRAQMAAKIFAGSFGYSQYTERDAVVDADVILALIEADRAAAVTDTKENT